MNHVLLSRKHGFSLVEILVGMAVGLIGITVITQVYLVNENYKRSTTSAGGAQVNGALALYNLERDLRMAGYGINDSRALGCGAMQYYYNTKYSSPPGAAAGALSPIIVAPAVITTAANTPDTITVMYGNDSRRMVPATLGANLNSTDTAITVDNAGGFSDSPGDLLLVAQGATCALMQITAGIAGAVLPRAAVAAQYNPSGASSLPSFLQAQAQVFDLGRPVVNKYSIGTSGNNQYNLKLLSYFTSTSSTVVPAFSDNAANAITLVDDIIDIKAEYGKDNGANNNTVNNAAYAAGDGIVDSYDATTPTTAAGWQQVLTVRLAVLARSQNFEKPDIPTNPCNATTIVPRWSGSYLLDNTTTHRPFVVPDTDGGALTVVGTGGLPVLQSCYKYRVFETVVPLRNMLWRRA